MTRVHEDGDEVGVVGVDVGAPEVAQRHLLRVARQVLGRQQHLDQRVHLLFEVGQHNAGLVDVDGVLGVVRRARLLAGALILGVQAALLASVRHCLVCHRHAPCAQGVSFCARRQSRASSQPAVLCCPGVHASAEEVPAAGQVGVAEEARWRGWRGARGSHEMLSLASLRFATEFGLALAAVRCFGPLMDIWGSAAVKHKFTV